MSRRKATWTEAIRASWTRGRGKRSATTRFVAALEPLETRALMTAAPNQAPIITLFSPTPTINEDTTFTSTAGNHLSFSDPDVVSGDVETLSLIVTGGKATLGTLSGLTGNGNGSESMTYSGSVSALNAALLGLTFTPFNNFNGTASIAVDVNDGGHNGADTAMHGTGTATINITPVNDKPSFSFTNSSLQVGDDDGTVSIPNFAVLISPGAPDESDQVVHFDVSVNSNDFNLFLTLPTISADGTLSFVVRPDAPGTSNRSSSFFANLTDNLGASFGRNFAIFVRPDNAAPVNSVPTKTLRAAENVPYVFSGAEFNPVMVSDSDGESGLEKITLTTPNGTLDLAGAVGTGNGTSTVTYTASLSALNAALNGLVFTPANNYTGPATIQITTDDLGNTGVKSNGAPADPLTDTDTIHLNVVAPSPLLISELFVDPPGADVPSEYVELRSLAANYSIPSGTYLISVTAHSTSITDDSGTTVYPPGMIWDLFDLSTDPRNPGNAIVTGSNGSLVILQNGNGYAPGGYVNAGATVLDNTPMGGEPVAPGPGFGNDADIPGSSYTGHSAITADTELPNPATTYLLVHSDHPLFPGMSLDAGASGSLDLTGLTVLDSVGLLAGGTSSPGDVGYGNINFSNSSSTTNQFTPDAQVVSAPFTANYVARSGNTIGWQASDWVASTVTAGPIASSWQLGSAANTSPSVLAQEPLNHIGSTNFQNNLPPTVTMTGTELVYSPGAGAVVADSGLALSDVDSSHAIGATLTIIGYVPGHDVLSFSNTATISGSFNSSTGVLTLTGWDTIAGYQAALRTVTFSNSDPTVQNRTIKVIVDTSELGSATRVINATAQAPAVYLGGGVVVNNATNYVGTPVLIAPSAVITDASDPGIVQLVVSIVSPQTGDVVTADAAVLAAHPNISVTGNLTSSLTLTGSLITSDYQAVLQSIRYVNLHFDGPGANSVAVQVVATDPTLSTSAVATTAISVVHSSVVSNRLLFYKGSSHYDTAGRPWATNPFSHDNAIAKDKSAYLPNGTGGTFTTTATFGNISSYDRGINGVMVDLAGFHGPISASDFIFKVGNNNTPSSWTNAPPVVTILDRNGAGTGGSDRIELIWNDNDISGVNGGKWLELIFKGNDAAGGFNLNTGLAASDIFFFGSAPGDTGLGDTVAAVVDNANDELHVRNNPKNMFQSIPLTNIDDFNRDSLVNVIDELFARNHTNNNLSATRFIKIALGVAAPDVVPAVTANVTAVAAATATHQIDVGVASGLVAGGSAWKLVDAPAATWLDHRLHSVDVGSAKPAHDRLAAWFEHLAKELPHTRKRAAADDALADVEGVCDDLLASLLAGRKT